MQRRAKWLQMKFCLGMRAASARRKNAVKTKPRQSSTDRAALISSNDICSKCRQHSMSVRVESASIQATRLL